MGIQINGTNDTITTNDGTISIDGGTTITGSLTGTTGTFSGDVGVAGTLTSEDKTNVDSVGLITARTGIKVGPITGVAATHYADGSIRTTGIITATSFVGGITGTSGAFSSSLDIADKIRHTGDTDTAIRFPSADTVTVETSGSERVRIDSDGQMGLGVTPDTWSTGKSITVGTSQGTLWGVSDQINLSGNAYFNSGWKAAATKAGASQIQQALGAIDFRVSGSVTADSAITFIDAVKITNTGKVGINSTSPNRQLSIVSDGGQLDLHDTDGTTTGYYTNAGVGQIFCRGNSGATAGSFEVWTHPAGGSITKRLTVRSDGDVLINTTQEFDSLNGRGNLVVGSGSGNEGLTIYSGTSNEGGIIFADGTSGSDAYPGQIQYNHSDNSMRFFTNTGVERLRIDSSGRLLVGTATEGDSSADDLTIAGDGNTGITIRSGVDHAGGLYFSDATTGAAEYKGYVQYDQQNDNLRLGCDSETVVWLHADKKLSVGADSVGYGQWSFLNIGSSGADATGGDTGMTIRADTGRTGNTITSNADWTLKLNNNAYAGTGIAGNTGSVVKILFNGATSNGWNAYGAMGLVVQGQSGSKGDLFFNTGGTTDGNERMRLTYNGYCGIGITNPSHKLHVVDGAGTALRLGNTTNASTAGLAYNWGGSYGLKCDPDNNAGGTRHIYMAVKGTTYFNLSDVGKITSTGTYNGTTTGGTAVYVESDGDLLRYTSSRKYKTDIETAEDKYADQILTCRPVWYRSTSDNDIKDSAKGKSDFGWFGFIAEEVAEINPRLVSYKTKEAQQQSDGTLKSVELDPSKYEAESVRYTDFIPLMVNLLKRQSDKITALEAKVAALESS